MRNQWAQIPVPPDLPQRIMNRVAAPVPTRPWPWATVVMLILVMAGGGYWRHQQQANQMAHRDILAATMAIEIWWSPDPPDGGIWLY